MKVSYTVDMSDRPAQPAAPDKREPMTWEAFATEAARRKLTTRSAFHTDSGVFEALDSDGRRCGMWGHNQGYFEQP